MFRLKCTEFGNDILYHHDEVNIGLCLGPPAGCTTIAITTSTSDMSTLPNWSHVVTTGTKSMVE